MSGVEKGHELELAKELEKFRKEGKYNVLVPTATLQEISPFHKPVLEIVNINPDPKGGDVYEVVSGSGNYSMTAASLSKISFAAGLIWNAKGCQRTDDGSKPKEVSYRMEAVVRKEDGTYMPLNAEYLIDLDVINEEISNSYEAKSQAIMKDPKNRWKESDRVAYVERSIKRDMLQKRKFRLQLAQTGAMGRVVKKILGLKSTYTKEELQRPFVVPKIVFSPDVSDPKVREMLLKQGLDATNLLFGGQEKTIIDRCEQIESKPGNGGNGKETVPDAEVIDEATGEILSEGKEEAKAPLPFEDLDLKAQEKFFQELMKRKGYDTKKLKKPLEHFTADDRKLFKAHLEKMKDVVVEELPFEE
jgi:hypothetical protein